MLNNNMKNIIFFIVISIFTTIGWAVTNIKSPIPLSTLTDFTCQYQAPNYLKIETKIADDILLQDEITDLIVDEFVNSDNYLIYQSKLITTSSEDIELKIVAIDSVTIPISKYPEINNADESQHLPFAYFGKSGIMHGLKVMPLIVRQYRYDKNSHSLVSYKNIEIELKSNNNFDAYRDHLFISPSWSQFFQNTILNYQADETMTFSSGLPKGYLIIVTDALYNTILPFAQWKNQKGWTVTVKRKSEIGTTSAAIKNYIAQAYATWTPKIEYVLLVGNATDIPPISSSQTVGDHLYACVDGDDLYPDLFVGRFPTSSTSELSVMVAKSIGYEQSPHLADTLWYKRALMVATTYQSSGVPVWTALVTKRWVRNLLINHNYYQVDTVFHPPISNGVGVIDTIINRGVTFVNGRGWGNREGWSYPYFKFQDVANLNNGWKLPIVTSFYCATGNFTATTNFGTTWLIAGSPTQPRGGVAFYGPIYATTSTRFNNCHDYGVYFGIFEEGITNLGPALFRGKIEMLNNFPMASDTLALTTHVCTYNILGDPSLEMWYGTTPKQFVVNYPNQLPIGSSQLTISVQNSNNQPVANALVSIFKNNEVKQISYTNESGLALFNFLTQTQDTLFVTVTKHNFLPHRGNVQIIPSALYVGYYNHSGSIIAGQTNNIMISLKNYGTTQTAYNTFATLRSSDNYITILDSTKSFGDIAPNQISINGPFQFIVATNCTNNHRINFQIAITSTSNSWQAGFNGIVRSAELSYKSHSVVDGNNNILEPNETANLIVKVYNRGLENISNVSAILRSANPYAIQVLDSIGYYGTINVGDSIQNSSDYFTIHAASSLAIGRKIYLQLVLRNSSYERIVEFPITIGNINFTAPLGPDQYGYWAYDNMDLAYA
ncbi:MAG: C25 family cysteine peptidase, partial [candidate division WOR-3 bacterium]